MFKRRVVLFAVTVVAGGVLTLSGCSTAADNFSDLQTEREPEDELPVLSGEDVRDTVDVSTSRYVGEYQGTSLWIAEGIQDSSICLIPVRGTSEWVVACGGNAGVGSRGPTGSFTVIPDGVPVPENATKVSENVYAEVS